MHFYGLKLESIEIPENVTEIGESAFESNSKLTTIRIPKNVTKIEGKAFYNIKTLTDIYIDNEESNISFGWNWNSLTDAYVHFSNCTHTIEKNTKDGIEIQDVTNNLIDGNIKCGETYKFKLLDSQGHIISNESVLIQTEGIYTNEEYPKIIIEPDENGIYTINSIKRNVIINIEEIEENDVIQSTDSNGVIWKYTYKNSEATNLKYESGLDGFVIEIPSSLDGYNVTSIGEYSFARKQQLKKIYLPETVNNICDRALENCYMIKDILIDNTENNVVFGENYNWNKNAEIHYKGCEHNIFVENYSYENLEMEEIGDNVKEGKIGCRKDYKFKLISETGEVITSEKVIVMANEKENSEQFDTERVIRNIVKNSNSMFLDAQESMYEIYPDNEGVYEIKNIHKNITIIIGSYQAQDENGITWNYSYKEGKAINVYYAYGELGETVEIPDTLNGYPVESLYNKQGPGNIFENAENISTIKNINMSNNITTIGEFAFCMLDNLENINLSGNLINVKKAAFCGCSKLEKIEFPDSVTMIDEMTFAYCNGMSKVKNLVNVDKIGDYTFYRCYNLKSIDIPNVTEICNNAFEECENLTEIDLPNVTNIGDSAFQRCSNLVSINLPNVTSIEYCTFYVCSSLTSIYIPNVTNIGNAAFEYCSNLAEIDLPNVTNIGTAAFFGCSSLASIEIPNVTNIGNAAFEYCSSLASINVSDDNTQYSSLEGILYNKEKTELIKCPEGKSEVTIPESVTSIGNGAFQRCSNLVSINLPNVTTIENSAFNECWNLTSIELPNVTSIGNGVFIECSSLISIELPNATSIGDYAFSYCTGLTSIELPNATSIGEWAFYNCRSLTGIVIPDTVTNIEGYAFYNWTSDQTIYIEASEQPEGWSSNWNENCNANIIWGYTGE